MNHKPFEELWAHQNVTLTYNLLFGALRVVEIMNEDLPYIEPEWKSALAIITATLAGIFLIGAIFWL